MVIARIRIFSLCLRNICTHTTHFLSWSFASSLSPFKNDLIQFCSIFNLFLIFFSVTLCYNNFLHNCFFLLEIVLVFFFQFHHTTEMLFSLNYEMFETRPIWSSLSHFMMLFFRSLLCKRWKAKMKKKIGVQSRGSLWFFFLK